MGMNTTKEYIGHDGIADAGTFHKWMMSAEGVKQIYHRIETNLVRLMIYRFKDTSIIYLGSGDHKDGAPVIIRIEGDTQENLEEICAAFERNFPRLNVTS